MKLHENINEASIFLRIMRGYYTKRRSVDPKRLVSDIRKVEKYLKKWQKEREKKKKAKITSMRLKRVDAIRSINYKQRSERLKIRQLWLTIDWNRLREEIMKNTYSYDFLARELKIPKSTIWCDINGKLIASAGTEILINWAIENGFKKRATLK